MKNIRSFLIFFALCLFILLGVFLWQYEASVELEVNVPVTFANLPSDLIIAGQPLKEVEVRMKGAKAILKAFSEKELSCAFDLARVSTGLITLTVDESNLQLPAGISAVHIEPTSITLRVEPKQIKTVPVAATLVDNPAPGYRVALTLSTPSTLQIIGAEKSVAGIDQLATHPISIKDVADSFKKEITVDLPSGVSIGNGGTTLVTVQVNIEENVVVRRFENIPVEGRNTAFPVKISPPNISIDVRGPENDLSSLSVENMVYVDLKDLPPGVYVRRPQFSLPPGSSFVQVNPAVVTITIGPS